MKTTNPKPTSPKYGVMNIGKINKENIKELFSSGVNFSGHIMNELTICYFLLERWPFGGQFSRLLLRALKIRPLMACSPKTPVVNLNLRALKEVTCRTMSPEVNFYKIWSVYWTQHLYLKLWKKLAFIWSKKVDSSFAKCSLIFKVYSRGLVMEILES